MLKNIGGKKIKIHTKKKKKIIHPKLYKKKKNKFFQKI